MSYPDRKAKLRYARWKNMMSRCYDPSDPSYSNYGGRGIGVCNRWQDRKLFYADTDLINKEGLTLERINNDLGYSPGNCRWANAKDQALNRRSNHLLTYKGTTKHITVWADELNLKRTTLLERINRYGWSVKRALETEVRH